jgi:hypothetical protein
VEAEAEAEEEEEAVEVAASERKKEKETKRVVSVVNSVVQKKKENAFSSRIRRSLSLTSKEGRAWDGASLFFSKEVGVEKRR